MTSPAPHNSFRTPTLPFRSTKMPRRLPSGRAIRSGQSHPGHSAGLAAGVGGGDVRISAPALPGMTTFSPMILAILLGTAFHNLVGTPAIARPGVTFSLRRLLRIGIILLGLQLTITQVIEVGGRGIGIIAATLVATFAFTVWMGKVLGVDRKLAQLIAAGTSICGASAVIATNTVTNAHDEDVAYAVACVTVFGSVAMFTYPLLPGLLHLDPHAFGLWSGASIHEIAQVVAAAFQDGQDGRRIRHHRKTIPRHAVGAHRDSAGVDVGAQRCKGAIRPRWRPRRGRRCPGSCSASWRWLGSTA